MRVPSPISRLFVLAAVALATVVVLVPGAGAHEAPYCGHGTVQGSTNRIVFVTHFVSGGGHWHKYDHYVRIAGGQWTHAHTPLKHCQHT
jgi:hypothetical protein